MVTAFVLVETGVGTGPKVVGSLKALPEVRMVDRVTGPYDVIATVELVDLQALGTFLNDRVRMLPGVQKTVTCVVVKS